MKKGESVKTNSNLQISVKGIGDINYLCDFIYLLFANEFLTI
jgi:hypothetical protein